ncbi:hypothetical protein VTN96DRAFT_9985 [Rasamsonia emersonii]
MDPKANKLCVKGASTCHILPSVRARPFQFLSDSGLSAVRFVLLDSTGVDDEFLWNGWRVTGCMAALPKAREIYPAVEMVSDKFTLRLSVILCTAQRDPT